MIYDEASDAIKISVAEFVSIARRGVSSTLPYDEDEPQDGELGKYELRAALGDTAVRELSLSAEVDGERLLVYGKARLGADGEIVIAKLSDREAASPSKELIAKARGEGFLLAHMLAEEDSLDSVSLTIVYISKGSNSKIQTREEVKRSAFERFFKKCLATVSIYSRPERERVKYRLPTMRSIKFPYKSIREGQSEFVKRAYKTLCRGGTLFALAPTGTGKTVSAIFPAVRAMGEGRCKKTFYFTPKTTTAAAAKECIELLSRSGAKIKAMVLTAKERACKNGLRCRDGRDKCENSKCNRLADAALELYDSDITVVTARDVEPVSKIHRLSLRACADLCRALRRRYMRFQLSFRPTGLYQALL